MKKVLTIILALTIVFCLVACGGNTNVPTDAAQQQPSGSIGSVSRPEPESTADASLAPANGESLNPAPANEEEEGSNILIAYFTMPETDGVDAVSSASRVIADGELLGNTQYIAQIIEQATDGELFHIQTVQEYPGEHDPLIDFAADEKAEGARPELSTHIDNLGNYDVIFIGFPNWWADLPMPLYTFLEEYDFSGKTIVPFSTHGGSGFSRTISTITDMEPDATVIQDGFTISRNNVTKAKDDVIAWIDGLGL